jgi:hypothetical protein
MKHIRYTTERTNNEFGGEDVIVRFYLQGEKKIIDKITVQDYGDSNAVDDSIQRHIDYLEERLYKVTGIEWDCDGVNPKTYKLPTDAVVIADDEEDVVDELSDKFGFCILGVGGIEKL